MSIPTGESYANYYYNLSNVYGSEFNNFTDSSFTDAFTEELAYVLNVFFTPALVLLGTIGNLLSIIVFYRGKLRVQSTSQYMSALAISDTIFLLQLIPPWLKAVTVSRVFARDGFCQCFVYLTYVSSSSSSWLVVSFTIERFVAVLYPLQRTRMCTVRRARIIIVGISFFCIAINTPVLKFAVPKGNDCNIDFDLMDHAARFNVLDTIFSFTLPLTIITMLNIWIMIGVCRLSRARGQLIKEEEMQPRHMLRHHTRAAMPGRRGKGTLQRSQQRITRMLLIVSSVFVLLNLPAYSMRIVAYANNMSSYEYNGRWAALQQICLLFFNSNFGINFFLYCMTGQNFRRALFQTFSCFARRLAGLKLLFCCWAEEHAQRPRPSVTNSLSINTEASAYAAASRVSLKQNKKGASSLCKDAYGSYVELWRFDNSRQEQPKREQYEMQLFPVHSYRFSSDRLERPVPLWPANSTRRNPFESTHSPSLPAILASLTFRPIQSNLEPGQAAPDRASGSESPPPLVNANAIETPLPMTPLENELKDLDAVPERVFRPIVRPQPSRQFSLPARQLHELEREDTPPPLINVPARRCPIQPPTARSALMQAPAAPHAVLPDS